MVSSVGRHVASLGLAGAIAIASIGSGWSAPEQRTGTFHVTATITVGPNVPTSQSLGGQVSLSVYGSDTPTAIFKTQSVSNGAVFSRTGSTAQVTIDVPYTFTFDSATYPTIKVVVYFNVSAGSIAYASVSRQYAVPANGKTTPITFTLAI